MDPSTIEKGGGSAQGLKLLLCENQLPPIEEAIEAARREVPRSNYHTEPYSGPLRELLAEKLGVSERHRRRSFGGNEPAECDRAAGRGALRAWCRELSFSGARSRSSRSWRSLAGVGVSDWELVPFGAASDVAVCQWHAIVRI